MTASLADRFPVGHTETLTHRVSEAVIDRFEAFSGDNNPLHMNTEYARSKGYSDRVAHGVTSLAWLSALIGTRLPGYGALWRSLRVDWLQPVFAGDEVTLSARVEAVSAEHRMLTLAVSASNQAGITLLRATAEVSVLDEQARVSASSVSTRPDRSRTAGQHTETQETILVLGGSGAIGSAIAEQLAGQGFSIVIGYHANEDKANQACERIAHNKGNARSLRVDVAKMSVEDLQNQLDELPAEFQRRAGLVVAGSSPLLFHAPEQISFEEMETMWRSNVRALWLGYHALRERMTENGWGRVVALGTSALVGTPPARNAAYVSAKSGLWGLVKSLALEAANDGTTFNMISPNMVETDYVRHVPKRVKMVEASKNPRRRLAQPEDVASLAAYLFSREADFINGCNLPLTGGGVMFG
ncbi:MAG: SDR family oxidoreductase [Pseudohongiellaceae bacterium]